MFFIFVSNLFFTCRKLYCLSCSLFQSLKNPNHARRVVVVLLTGQKLEAMCDPSTTGQQLFEAVITHAELPEFFFFGLTYINGMFIPC